MIVWRVVGMYVYVRRRVTWLSDWFVIRSFPAQSGEFCEDKLTWKTDILVCVNSVKIS